MPSPCWSRRGGEIVVVILPGVGKREIPMERAAGHPELRHIFNKACDAETEAHRWKGDTPPIGKGFVDLSNAEIQTLNGRQPLPRLREITTRPCPTQPHRLEHQAGSVTNFARRLGRESPARPSWSISVNHDKRKTEPSVFAYRLPRLNAKRRERMKGFQSVGRTCRLRTLPASPGKLFVSVVVLQGFEGADQTKRRSTSKLFRIDLASRTREELPLPQPRGAEGSPDALPRTDVNLLRADVKRERVVFFLNRQPRSDAEIDGLWECRAQGTPKHLRAMDAGAGTEHRMGAGLGDWAGAVRGDQWLMASSNGALEADVTTLGVRRLWSVPRSAR